MSSASLPEIIREAKVSPQCLEQEISDQHILDFADFCTPYQLIGPHLGVSQTSLDDIEADVHKQPLRRRALLQRWRDADTYKATYMKLLRALTACKRADSAYKICCALAAEEAGNGNVKHVHARSVRFREQSYEFRSGCTYWGGSYRV